MSMIAMDINKKIKHILPDNYQLGGYVAKKNLHLGYTGNINIFCKSLLLWFYANC